MCMNLYSRQISGFIWICVLVCTQSLPRMQSDSLQRSDGEEEEDGSLTLSPVRHDSSHDNDLLGWEGLTPSLPVTFEQEGKDGVSVSLGDLVRHMHPYCMAICVENDEGEQMLPEGGILLEVVDQGENGEPILAIPDMDLPVSLPLTEQSSENEGKVSDEAEDVASDSSEHIVVDDDDDDDVTVSVAPVKVTPDLCADVKDKMIKRQKEEIKATSPSRRKKKKKCKEHFQPKPVEGRVLRSGTVRNTEQDSPRKAEKRLIKEEKKHKLPKVPLASTTSSSVKPKKLNPCPTETQTKVTITTLLAETKMEVATPVSSREKTALLNANPEKSQRSDSPTVVSCQQLDETPEQPAPEKLQDSSAAPSAVLPPVSSEYPAAALSPVTPQMTPPVGEALPPVAPAVPDPKPKSLSLAEYRRLRQQKKPAPVENKDNSNSTRWPSLPEPPKELLPIPCLPDPSLMDPRRPNPQVAKKEVEEVRPAWQPRGPCAPPTPEALLVPPAYMVASSSKASAAVPVPKPQQTPEPSKPSSPQKPSVPDPTPVNNVPTHQHITAEPSMPQSSGSPAPVKPDTQFMALADRKCSPALSGAKGGVDERPQSQTVSSKSVELTKTTTEVMKPTAATVSAPSASQKITVVFRNVPDVTAPTLLDNPIRSDSKSAKAAANGTKVACTTHPSDCQSLNAEPVVLETKEKPTTAVKPQRARSPTQELIEAFTSEIGELKVDFIF